MHGLYLSRKCEDITQLSRDLLGLHCWFHRNVAFSALIRGADLKGWKTALTKTWLYRGTLHGVAPDDLPNLLAIHAGESSLAWLLGEEKTGELIEKIIALMEDGVYSRSEMRCIFMDDYDKGVLDHVFSSWGGIFVYLARLGKVAFRNMTSRDFDLINAEPTKTFDEALPELLTRFFTSYGPATIDDAAWFFGIQKEDVKRLFPSDSEGLSRLEYNKNVYYYVEDGNDLGDIPECTLLSGFDPLIVSYTERSAVLPKEYRSSVILKSGICLPTVAVNGQVAGIWNIKKKEPVVQFFSSQPKRIKDRALDLVDEMRWKTEGMI